MRDYKKITKREHLELCKSCIAGFCCQDGVDLDLEEAKRISKLKLNLKRP